MALITRHQDRSPRPVPASHPEARLDVRTDLIRLQRRKSRPARHSLLRLHDEILSRDDRLGRRRPEVVERLLAEVLKYTDDARAAQLKKDREALLKAR